MMTYQNTKHRSAYLALMLLPPLAIAACATTDTEAPAEAVAQSAATSIQPLANMEAQLALRTEPEVEAEQSGPIDPPPSLSSEPTMPSADVELMLANAQEDLEQVADGVNADDSVASAPTGVSAPAQLVFRFGFDSAELSAEDQVALREHAAYLLQHPEVSISLRGHTDSFGDPRYNQALSERRARHVADKLIEAGVPEGQIQIEGLGDSEPLALAAEPREHRRVELRYQENYLVDSR